MKYLLIEWSDVQELMTKEGFRDNACLANDKQFLESNTIIHDSAYFVSEEWLKKVND